MFENWDLAFVVTFNIDYSECLLSIVTVVVFFAVLTKEVIPVPLLQNYGVALKPFQSATANME